LWAATIPATAASFGSAAGGGAGVPLEVVVGAGGSDVGEGAAVLDEVASGDGDVLPSPRVLASSLQAEASAAHTRPVTKRCLPIIQR